MHRRKFLCAPLAGLLSFLPGRSERRPPRVIIRNCRLEPIWRSGSVTIQEDAIILDGLYPETVNSGFGSVELHSTS